MDILHQLGSLVLGAVPTMILFLILVVAYDVLVRRPLERTLAERRARTSGAVEQARGAIAAAEAETAVYEDKLRSARAEIFADRERRLKQRQAERETAVAAAREQAQTRVAGAKNEIAASVESARVQIEGAVEELGERIVRAILPASATERVEVHQ
jgi:F-type H+-transporting ATPase subunit b